MKRATESNKTNTHPTGRRSRLRAAKPRSCTGGSGSEDRQESGRSNAGRQNRPTGRGNPSSGDQQESAVSTIGRPNQRREKENRDGEPRLGTGKPTYGLRLKARGRSTTVLQGKTGGTAESPSDNGKSGSEDRQRTVRSTAGRQTRPTGRGDSSPEEQQKSGVSAIGRQRQTRGTVEPRLGTGKPTHEDQQKAGGRSITVLQERSGTAASPSATEQPGSEDRQQSGRFTAKKQRRPRIGGPQLPTVKPSPGEQRMSIGMQRRGDSADRQKSAGFSRWSGSGEPSPGTEELSPADREQSVESGDDEAGEPQPGTEEPRPGTEESITCVKRSASPSPPVPTEPSLQAGGAKAVENLEEDKQSSTNLASLPFLEPCQTVRSDEAVSTLEVKYSVDGITTAAVVNTSDAWEHYASVSPDELQAAVAKCEHGFRFKTENKVSKGRVLYYYCRRIKVKAKQQCQRRLMAYVANGENNNYSLNLKGTHTCLTAAPGDLAKVPLDQGDIAHMDDMLRTGIPLKDIKKHMKVKNQQVSKNRINYAVKQASEAIYGCGTLSLGELAAWAKLKSPTPSDHEAAFVIAHDINADNGCFRVVYSSRKLLSLFKRLDVLCADCTFKTTLQGYPLVVVCLVDQMRHAHPVAFATITKQEQADYAFVFATIFDQCVRLGVDVNVRAFISDGEMALKNAARSVFGGHVLLVNCYFHVVQNIKKHLAKARDMPSDIKEDILKDVGRIQAAPTTMHFEKACELFMEKYKGFPDFIQFIRKYANNEFFRNWYEGALPGYPATNNSLEALNRAIKEGHLDRIRESFGTFKTRIMNVVENYSKQNRRVHETRTITLEDERKAFTFIKAGRKARTVEDVSEKQTYVYVPAGCSTEVTGREIEIFNNPPSRNLQQYLTDMDIVHRVAVTGEHWNMWNCSCRWFFKHNSCFHVVVAAVSRGRHQLRQEANTSCLTQKRPPGRPKKMSKALIID